MLEDSELTVLLMLAHAYGPDCRTVEVSADMRLLRCGIGQEFFGSHKLLCRAGLLDGEQPEGGERGGGGPHRLRLRPEGFTEPALPAATSTIHAALAGTSD